MIRVTGVLEHCPGGYRVQVEYTEAYTDGTSRMEWVFVAAADVRGKSREERIEALRDAVSDGIVADVQGVDLRDAPTQTKAVLEARMVRQYERWQRWKLTREEAAARSLATAVVNALAGVENSAWTTYLASIQAWRSAP